MTCIFAATLCFFISSVSFSCAKEERPNIVFILADDLGWDDVSFHGSKQIPTPNLDLLAYDGILMANYYVQPICTPTRGALLTGRHPIHTGLQQSVIFGSEPYGLPLNETIMPQYLKKLGYKTHMVGKWHLGFFAEEYTPIHRGFDSHFGYFMGKEDYWDHCDNEGDWHLGFHAVEFTPMRRGFDSHYGYYQGMEDYWDHTYEAASKETWGLDFRRGDEVIRTDFGKYSTELFSAEATKIIHQHDVSDPLYLYLPFQAVHSANPWKPLEAPFEYIQRFSHIQDPNRRIFAAMVSALDDAVGNVTKALHDKGMLNNSIIVFSTDNGGPPAGFDMNHASNYPLRGTKAGLWEGGNRGCGFIWSPHLQKSGYTSHSMMQVMDWLPTLLHGAGFNMSELPDNLDGLDHWETLSKQLREPVRTEMLHNIDGKGTSWALRSGDFKLLQARDVTKSWDKWYQPEQLKKADEVLRFHPEHSSAQDSEEAPLHMFRSPLENTFKKMGRLVEKGSPFMIKCDPQPANASTNCKVSEKPCLYNITADPCEYNNLADKRPDLVAKLYSRMLEIKKTAVPPGNKPQDPAGFPIHHGGVWVPWIKLDKSQLHESNIDEH